jgi:hypothetical protein
MLQTQTFWPLVSTTNNFAITHTSTYTYLVHPLIHLACYIGHGLVFHQQMRNIEVFDDKLFIHWLGVVHVYNELLCGNITWYEISRGSKLVANVFRHAAVTGVAAGFGGSRKKRKRRSEVTEAHAPSQRANAARNLPCMYCKCTVSTSERSTDEIRDRHSWLRALCLLYNFVKKIAVFVVYDSMHLLYD